MKPRIIIRTAVFSVALLAGTVWLALAAATPTRFTAFDPQARALVERMTLEEKIGQMTQPDQENVRDLSDIENYFFG
ncbi:MAG: beta-glucosidase, partial [Bryobacteraceae bacterium]